MRKGLSALFLELSSQSWMAQHGNSKYNVDVNLKSKFMLLRTYA